MEIKKNVSYNIKMSGKEISDLVTAIEVIYPVIVDRVDPNKVASILMFKDEIVLAANEA